MSRWLVECAETVKLHTLYERVSNRLLGSGRPLNISHIAWVYPLTTTVVHFTSQEE